MAVVGLDEVVVESDEVVVELDEVVVVVVDELCNTLHCLHYIPANKPNKKWFA